MPLPLEMFVCERVRKTGHTKAIKGKMEKEQNEREREKGEKETKRERERRQQSAAMSLGMCVRPRFTRWLLLLVALVYPFLSQPL